MRRILGILILVLVLYGMILGTDSKARTVRNHQQIAERLAFYGVLTLGAGVLIISGGIDLSIGAVVCLSSVLLALLLRNSVAAPLAVLIVLSLSVLIGIFHGLLVTRLGLQPFIITLCGLFIYRGLSMWLALPDPMVPVHGLLRFLSLGLYSPDMGFAGSAGSVGIGEASKQVPGLVYLSTGYLGPVPVRFFLLLVLAGLFAVLLHLSVYGRYLYAIGSNEQAARYAGIPSNRYKILAYVLCSLMAGIGGILEILDVKTASPSSAGQWYELYAITGAVLGGCSLRGGEGTVAGILLGTAVLPLLRNLSTFARIPSDLEFMVIGVALLLGTIADELLKRRTAGKG